MECQKGGFGIIEAVEKTVNVIRQKVARPAVSVEGGTWMMQSAGVALVTLLEGLC